MKKQILLMIAACGFICTANAKAQQTQQTQSIDAKFSTSRNKVYLNETVELTLTIKTVGITLAQQLQLLNMPDGSKLQALDPFTPLETKREQVNGNIVEIRSFKGSFRPIVTGQITISPKIAVSVLKKRKSAIFGATVTQRHPHTLAARPLTLSVSPLPLAGRPQKFSQAVGNLKFDVKLEPADVAVGDLITVHTSVRGNGYIDEVKPIALTDTRYFRIYAPQTAEQNDSIRRFSQTIVVLSTNALEVPELSFSYFDPAESKYKTISRGPFPLTFHDEKRLDAKAYKPIEPLQTAIKPHKMDSNQDSSTTTSTLDASTITGFRDDSALTQSKTYMRIAPAHSALTTAVIPSGRKILILEAYKGWNKVEFANNRGWIISDRLSGP